MRLDIRFNMLCCRCVVDDTVFLFLFVRAPALAKLLVQSVKCPTCGHANDFDFFFEEKVHNNAVITNIDVDAIDQATSYKKAKRLSSEGT